MSAPARDPLQIPPDLQARVEAVPGLRALYRRGSRLRTLGLACLPLCLLFGVHLLVSLDANTGYPVWAHVPAGFGDGGRTAASWVFLFVVSGVVAAWMAWGLRDVLANRGVRRFTYACVFGSMLLWAALVGGSIGSPGFSAKDVGEGEPLDYAKLETLIASPAFATFSPQWQHYLRAQAGLRVGPQSSELTDTARALSRGQSIGVPVPALWQARFEKDAGLAASARSLHWRDQQWLRRALFGHAWVLSLLAIPALLALGAALATLGHLLRQRVKVINGLLQQLPV